jgi:hypothetical protein
MRVLMLAPFERGRGQGGSQRATAVAERLEQRGIEVGWQLVRKRTTTRRAKLLALTRGEPALAGLYQPPASLASGSWDAVLIAHSYLVAAVRTSVGAIPTIVDFHNLEWRGLQDGSELERRGRGLPTPRDGYLTLQVALLRRFERRIVEAAPLSLLVSADELAWARTFTREGQLAFAPSVLPRSEEEAAEAVLARRASEPRQLVYVGTLSFPTNLLSLQRFLARDWPAMRAAEPALTLTIAGRCGEPERVELERHPGVTAAGFVEDLAPLLARCAAVVMPFDGAAGTSLRPLFYALAGLPVIAPPDAFRGIPFRVGTAVRTPEEWASAVTDLAAGRSTDLDAAREAARLHQSDPRPWDHLAKVIAELARSPVRA